MTFLPSGVLSNNLHIHVSYPRSCHFRHPSHPPWFDHSNNIRGISSIDKVWSFQFDHLLYNLSFSHTSAAPRLLKLWVRIPPDAWMFVCCECCVLSGRDLCNGLITGPEESYRLWRVVVGDLETSSSMRRPWPALGCNAIGKKFLIFKMKSIRFHYSPEASVISLVYKYLSTA